MIRRLSSFHNRVARYITGRHIKELEDGTYYCPPTEEVLDAAGLEGTTIQKYAMSSTIYWKCKRSTALSTKKLFGGKLEKAKMTGDIILITKIDDHQKLSAPIRVAKLFAKTEADFAAESVSLYGNEVNTHTHTGSAVSIIEWRDISLADISKNSRMELIIVPQWTRCLKRRVWRR